MCWASEPFSFINYIESDLGQMITNTRLLLIYLQVMVFKYSGISVIFVLFLLYIFASILFCFCVR